MALWIHKHAPKTLDELTCHTSINEQLGQFARQGNVPNLIFYGRAGGGRMTRVRCFLHAIFGDGVYMVKTSAIQLNAKSAQEIFQVASNHHVEVSADEMGRRDKEVVSNLIKKSVGQTSNVFQSKGPNFRVVVIKDADQLTWDAQAALRRTMETYHSNCRVFLVCESLSKLMKPLRSRCLCLRIPLPENEEILSVLKKVAAQESLTPKVEYLVALAKSSRRNLERALLMLELAAVQGYPHPDSLNYLPWELAVVEMVNKIVTDPSASSLLAVRDLAYELYSSNHSIPDVLELAHRLMMTHLSADMHDLRLKLSRAACLYSGAMSRCQNEVVQLEAFFAQSALAIKQKQIETGM